MPQKGQCMCVRVQIYRISGTCTTGCVAGRHAFSKMRFLLIVSFVCSSVMCFVHCIWGGERLLVRMSTLTTIQEYSKTFWTSLQMFQKKSMLSDMFFFVLTNWFRLLNERMWCVWKLVRHTGNSLLLLLFLCPWSNVIKNN